MDHYHRAIDEWNSSKDNLELFSRETFHETDIRCKVIDPILKLIGWTEDCITREPHTKEGYIDYLVDSGNNRFVLEAKRVGTFRMPANKVIVNAMTNGRSSMELYDAITQVRKYGKEMDVPFCVVSNGLQIAITRTYPSTNGLPDTILLNGPNAITENFTLLFDICNPFTDGDDAFRRHLKNDGNSRLKPAFKKSLSDALFHKNIVVQANPLRQYLTPIIHEYFGEITDNEAKLDKLYCHTDQQDAFGEQILQYLRGRSKILGFPVQEIKISQESAGEFGQDYKLSYQGRERGQVFLIVGPVGAGKSTFLSHFYNNVLDNNSRKHLIWVVLNFLPFLEKETHFTVQEYALRQMEIQIVKEAADRNVDIDDWNVIKDIYAEDVVRLSKGFLSMYVGKDVFEEKLSGELYSRKQSDPVDFWTKTIVYLKEKRNIEICFVMDNVDQLSQELQVEITLKAHQIAQTYNSLSIVTVRDETFWNLLRNDLPGNAFRPSAYRVIPPSASSMIQRRLQRARVDNKNRNIRHQDREGRVTVTFNLNDFLEGIEDSIKRDQEDIFSQISGANMRIALELFETYLLSNKIDWRYFLKKLTKAPSELRQEVIHSLGFGELKYYDSSKTRLVNLFVYDEEFQSHFTLIRVLQALKDNQNHKESYDLGNGYVSVDHLLSLIQPYCVTESALRQKVIQLMEYNLVDSDIGSRRMNDTEHHLQLKYLKITPTGVFYLEELCCSAIYLFMVSLDTPIVEQNRYQSMLKLSRSPLLYAEHGSRKRFELAEEFMNYIKTQEEKEFQYLSARNLDGKFSRISPIISSSLQREKFNLPKPQVNRETRFRPKR